MDAAMGLRAEPADRYRKRAGEGALERADGAEPRRRDPGPLDPEGAIPDLVADPDLGVHGLLETIEPARAPVPQLGPDLECRRHAAHQTLSRALGERVGEPYFHPHRVGENPRQVQRDVERVGAPAAEQRECNRARWALACAAESP